MPAGRPTKLTPEAAEAIAEKAAGGAPWSVCAEAAGVCRVTLWTWLERGKAEREAGETDSIYVQFLNTLEQKKAAAVLESHAKVRRGEQGWQGGAWFLERTERVELAPPTSKLEHTGKDGGPIESRMLTAEEVAKLEAAARAEFLAEMKRSSHDG